MDLAIQGHGEYPAKQASLIYSFFRYKGNSYGSVFFIVETTGVLLGLNQPNEAKKKDC